MNSLNLVFVLQVLDLDATIHASTMSNREKGVDLCALGDAFIDTHPHPPLSTPNMRHRISFQVEEVLMIKLITSQFGTICIVLGLPFLSTIPAQ